jgi:hypothetical protein
MTHADLTDPPLLARDRRRCVRLAGGEVNPARRASVFNELPLYTF